MGFMIKHSTKSTCYVFNMLLCTLDLDSTELQPLRTIQDYTVLLDFLTNTTHQELVDVHKIQVPLLQRKNDWTQKL